MAFIRPKALVALAAVLSLSAVSLAAGQSDQKYHFALVGKNGNTIEDWSGPTPKFQKGNEDRLYVEKDGQRYLITDPATISRIRSAYAPVMKIAGQEAALGEKQAHLGGDQAKIGEKQAALGEKLGGLGGQLGELEAGNDPDLRAKSKAIQAQMDELQKQMNDLDRHMAGPSRKQRMLDDQQQALGRQEREADKKARIKVDSTLDSAFARGLAKPG